MAIPMPDVDRIVTYIEGCQTPDGGYFFAKVPPSGTKDTYHAVAALRLLGRRPHRADRLAAWCERTLAERGPLLRPAHLFHLVGVAQALGLDPAPLRDRAAGLRAFENPLGGYGAWEHVDVETPSELEETSLAASALAALGLAADRERIARFVLRFRNPDGGFGGGGRSTLASTYYALATLASLGCAGPAPQETAGWLRDRERRWAVSYLEDLFWLVGALGAAGLPLEQPDRAARFALACQRPSGGFGRAWTGIATLEYTHQALEIVRAAGVLGDGKHDHAPTR